MQSVLNKKKLKNVWASLSIGTVLLTSSCGTVQIKDHEFCGDLGSSGASCFHTLKTDSRDIPKPEWDAYRFGQICETADVFSDWKAVIEKLCSESHKCTYEQQAQALSTVMAILDQFQMRVDNFKAKAQVSPK